MTDQDWFDQRPLRCETCPRCKGGGIIEKAYALAPNGEPIEGAPTDAICAFVVGSFDIFTSCREAVDLAKASSRPIAFQFLDHLVVARSTDNGETIAREWWFKQYNETPEETQARR